MKKRILYMFVVSMIAFVIFILGIAVILFRFDNPSWTVIRVWAIMVFVAACAWNCIHFYRKEKKKREDEENDNYKGVY